MYCKCYGCAYQEWEGVVKGDKNTTLSCARMNVLCQRDQRPRVIHQMNDE